MQYAGAFWNLLTNHLVIDVTSVQLSEYQWSYAVKDRRTKQALQNLLLQSQLHHADIARHLFTLTRNMVMF